MSDPGASEYFFDDRAIEVWRVSFTHGFEDTWRNLTRNSVRVSLLARVLSKAGSVSDMDREARDPEEWIHGTWR